MKRKNYLLSILLCFSLILSLGMSNPISIAASSKYSQASVDKTSIHSASLQDYFKANQKNKEPIIFVHGLFGWGGNEVLGINYWGGFSSLQEMLTNDGYTVYTPSVGPVASVWDRACELYAYIVGGTVDYGKAHSEKFGHARYGRTFSGICPELLTSDSHKIHLLGHSMGGETIRTLAQLLEQGDKDEMASTGEDTSPLFEGNHHWIRSITTIATPHNGSQFSDSCIQFDPAFHDFFALLAAQTGSDISHLNLDFKLDQWGLKQAPGEPYESYFKRVSQSKIWGETTDLSCWDLSLKGAEELNSWVKAQDDIYYFSISCSNTHESSTTKQQVPNWNMNPLLLPSSLVMGAYTKDKVTKMKVDDNWRINDGLVSLHSAIAPKEGSTDTWRNFDGNIIPGTWNYLGHVQNTDHIEIICQLNPSTREEIHNLYRNIANMLYSLS